MTDAAPRIWAFHAGPFVGYFVGKEEVGTFVSEYILRAEHERIVAETRREALEEAATRLANARHTFCLASPGTDTEFHSWLAGLDHAATIMKGADNG